MSREPLGLVVAVARNGIIGQGNALPWHLPEDLAHFKKVTLGHAIVMGRKTYESIGRPLPKRRNIVVSRAAGYSAPGCEVYSSLAIALHHARESDPMPFVIGGGALYAEALPLVTDLFVTEIDRDVQGDTLFPPFDRSAFTEVERRAGSTEGVTFVHLTRK